MATSEAECVCVYVCVYRGVRVGGRHRRGGGDHTGEIPDPVIPALALVEADADTEGP